MRMLARFLLCALLVLAGAQRAARADDGGTPLGKDLAGEACSLAAPTGATSSGAARSFAVLCGARQPSGTLTVVPLRTPLPEESKARHDALIAAAREVPGGIGDPSRLSCDAGRSFAPGADSVLFSCSLTADGWPRIVMITAMGSALYHGEGVPALLPVLEQAVAVVSGHPLSPAEMEGGLRALGARFPAALAHAGGADMASYATLVDLARHDSAERDYAGAEAAYRRALEIVAHLFGANSSAAGETLAELALQVSNQGRFDEAEGLFRRAQPIIEASGTVATRARFASYQALDAANQQHYADALKYARQATEMRRAQLNGSNSGPTSNLDVAQDQLPSSRGELAHSLRIEAMIALRVGDLPSAIAAADEVLRILDEEPSLPLWWRPDAVAMMAEINARRDRVVEAERQYREAVDLDQKLFGESAPTAFTELEFGRFYTEQEFYPGAVAMFRRALAILAKDDVARASIVPDQVIPFLTAGAALVQKEPGQGGALDADMFAASQLVSSDVAGRTIARAAARLAADTPALADLVRAAQEAQRQRDATRLELAAETAKPDELRNAARETQLADAVRAQSAKAGELAAKIATAFPDYAKLANPGPADLAAMKAALGEHEGFLSFVIGGHSSFVLLLTSGGLTVRPIAVTHDSIAADVKELRSAFVPELGSVQDFDLVAANELYRKLLGPISDQLAGLDRLVVAPSGALASLPFALLVTEPPKPEARHDYAAAAWLVRRMALSQIPSPRAFLALRAAARRRIPAPKPFLAVADPSFTGTTAAGAAALADLAARCRADGPIPAALLRALPPLTETADEARAVGRLVGAGDDALLLGPKATEADLRAKPLDQYGILYFATHGLLPGELNCESEPGLALSPPAAPARTTDEDGLLDAGEIAELKLNADIVVLSACNTAESAGQFGGEALAGLADAFFSAGARTVLASHWEVPSLATVKLMTGVFASLGRQEQGGLAEALRQSQLALIAQPQTAHPFYWAAFSVIGDGEYSTAAAFKASPPGEGRT